MVNLEWGKEELWQKLWHIQRIIEILSEVLTKPLSKFASKIITRLPFSSFFFRPLFLNEVYMALGLWEPYVRSNLPIRKGDIFIDIGAHIGYHTVYASKKVGKEGLVVAVEPDKRNVKVLRRNIKAIKASNVLVYEMAIGSNGFLCLRPNENPLHTKAARKDTDGKYMVPSMSLNRLLQEITKLKNTESHSITVKIDIDREESDIIKGGLSFLRNSSPTLIIESWNPRELKAALQPLGYVSRILYGGIFIYHKETTTCRK